jgi:hypothetical protein
MAGVKENSDLKNTNEAIKQFLEFLFVENSWLTWLHIGILVGTLVLAIWLWYVHRRAESVGFAATCRVPQTPCSSMAREWLDGVRQSNSQFLVAFGIGAVAFAIGVWFESRGSSGMSVQVATYIPAIVLALSQMSGIIRSGARIKKHLGV